MTPLVTTSTYILSVGVVLAQIFSLVLIVLLFTKKDVPVLFKDTFITLCVVVFGAVFGSLFYSDIAGFLPCNLCWYERIFMYPQAVILIIALIRKEKAFALDCILWLSVAGALLSGYHYYGQMFNAGALPCPLPGEGVSCAFRPFVTFGYITIPMMAFASFLTNALVAIYAKFELRRNK